ncbi:hypothetical protein BURPS406E_D0239 [Burkholderia pseudomallei 406e]|nr:hypothetical protein BURPS406E_D0239 [Burkholderia pseudomallei 406e]EDS83107.1 hypothetical protein BURPSS13_X0901 [Burkholderia pseudomallei S13]EEH26984.1 hypothetical protein BUH_7143 [Burkholderia pseudomallei Pakistan 9]
MRAFAVGAAPGGRRGPAAGRFACCCCPRSGPSPVRAARFAWRAVRHRTDNIELTTSN